MKRILVVNRARSFCSTPVAALLSSLSSAFLAYCGVLINQKSIEEFEVRAQCASSHYVALTGSSPTTYESTDQHAAHVAFVTELIEDDLPSLPDRHSLAELIVSESRKADIDPLFVTAVVRTESMFRHKAVSHRGAKGLMQLMPSTGYYVAKLSKIELKNTDALQNPETNIKLGIWYLKHLHERFKGDTERALVAYNWGPTNVNRALARGSAVPQQARQYAHKVLSRHSAWTDRLRQFASLRAATAVG